MAEAPTIPGGGDQSTALGRPTVLLNDVHVTYRVAGEHRPRLRDIFSGRRSESTKHIRKIHAVRGISLTAYQGEAIGVIGMNGSGKSTLMRAIAGLLPATSGDVFASSQPALLGVGAALKPDATGRQNILLGGLALGLSKKEVESQTDEIIEFTGLEQFIDLPLKTYSSGMKARLLFAISTAIQPEILLIDEGLAVGDEVFRDRSNERIQKLISEAGTVFIVTHSLDTVTETCERAIWIHQGVIQADDDPLKVVRSYRQFVKEQR